MFPSFPIFNFRQSETAACLQMTLRDNASFIFIFEFLGMVAPQLKRNCFTGGHAFKYSKNLIDNLQLMNTIKEKLR